MTKKKVEDEVVESEVVEEVVVDEAHLQKTLKMAFFYSDQHKRIEPRIMYFRDYMEREYRFVKNA